MKFLPRLLVSGVMVVMLAFTTVAVPIAHAEVSDAQIAAQREVAETTAIQAWQEQVRYVLYVLINRLEERIA